MQCGWKSGDVGPMEFNCTVQIPADGGVIIYNVMCAEDLSGDIYKCGSIRVGTSITGT